MIEDWTSYRVADFVPFTADVYLRLLERVGETFWPVHLLTVALGLAAAWLGLRGRGRIGCLMLAAVWAWVGVTFLMQRYAQLNWAGEWFGWGFLAQAGLLLAIGASGAGQREAMARWHRPDRMAIVLAGFGLLGYPLIAPLAGHGAFGAETFGIHPDPTAVATLGIVVIALRGPALWLVLPVPLLWCLVTALTLYALDAPWAPVPVAAVVLAILTVIGRSLARNRSLTSG